MSEIRVYDTRYIESLRTEYVFCGDEQLPPFRIAAMLTEREQRIAELERKLQELENRKTGSTV